MKKSLIAVTLIIAIHFCLCGYSLKPIPQAVVYDLSTIDEWLVMDIWNDGICDFNAYCYDGTDACGDPLDVSHALANFKTNVMKFAYYDAYIQGLDADSPEMIKLKADWELLKNEIANAYIAYLPYDNSLPVGTKVYDCSMYERYSSAFRNDLRVFGF